MEVALWIIAICMLPIGALAWLFLVDDVIPDIWRGLRKRYQDRQWRREAARR